MHDDNNLRFGMGIGVCLFTEALAAVVFAKEAIKQHKRAIEAEKQITILDTALDLYEIANGALSREIEESESKES